MQLLVDRQVERTNRNLMLTAAALLAALAAAAVLARGYYDDYFRGPFAATLPGVAEARGEVPARAFVRLEGELVDTGYQEISIKQDKYTHREKSRTTSADYLVLQDGAHTLLVKAPVGARGAGVAGWLREPEDVDRRVLARIRADEPDLASSLLPLVLDATEGRGAGTAGLVAGGAVLLLALVLLQRWSSRRARPATHPIWKRLAQLGEARSLAAQLDMEARASDVERFKGGARLTRSWLLRERLYGLDLVLVDRLVWIHKKVTTQKQYFITVGRQYDAIVCDRDGAQLSLRAKEAEVDRLLTALAERAPWALAGWTAELEQAWAKQRPQVIAAVDQRREALRRAAGGAAPG